ncbi:class I SAM-dependent methyltransferase [Cryobacterium sinapicolor]|uniref:Class I SAM-dependent methyltransferase n=1 Tax=Cryobacterium sinapicolor TaxID=1259236 RepID=A0ABY2JBD5_9MICO|nr:MULTISPECIES: class I SAM-dependent methyltransferase [Cryobacterium]TFC91394.1 class I SAM-dependent methyltransferase [Cryobacterium sp. TMT3-29-2]TFD02141.1 class I SAM-dependent methyltransferase [Cryobacterium sinapicolor]
MSNTSTDAGAATPAGPARITWEEAGQTRSALWHSESGWAPPQRVIIADDTLTADSAYRLAQNGTGMLWRGDFQNARQLLSALARRADRGRHAPTTDLAAAFRHHRSEALRRARLLALVLVPLDADYTVPLRRAPDVRRACTETYGPTTDASVTALRELVGVIGAHEWRTTGVDVPALGARIHPHYGVFSPVRGEYLDLVNTAPLPAAWAGGAGETGAGESGSSARAASAFDIGTGTGVLAAVLARRGIRHVVGTDQEPRALACARENITRLGLAGSVEIARADLFPAGRADLVVCNPPWIPASAVTATDFAVYDPDSRMLRGFLSGLADHLEPAGEGWLVLSDIAEHLGLRSRGELLDLIEDSGLEVVARLDTKPVHGRAADASDPLHAARSKEVTSLWRLRAVPAPAQAPDVAADVADAAR